MEDVRHKALAKESDVQKLLGARIKELRKQKGLTQEKLAEASNVHASEIGPVEAGKKYPKSSTLARIARSLGVPLYQLWMFEPDVPIKEQALQELMDLLKSGNNQELKYLLTIAREHRKSYG